MTVSRTTSGILPSDKAAAAAAKAAAQEQEQHGAAAGLEHIHVLELLPAVAHILPSCCKCGGSTAFRQPQVAIAAAGHQ
jgi:hypothetical protein